MSKFKNVPVEEGTKIILEKETTLGEIEVLYQKWSWDGIVAESIIFLDADVAGLEDDEIEAELRASPLINADSSITLKRSVSGFTFVNFNFKTE